MKENKILCFLCGVVAGIATVECLNRIVENKAHTTQDKRDERKITLPKPIQMAITYR